MMTDHSLDLAPGCFGRALTFKAKATECVACPFAARCEPISVERTERFRAELGIVVKRTAPKTAAVKAPSTTATLTKRISAQTEAILQRIDAGGIKVVEGIRSGTNPFSMHSSAYLCVACHILLAKRSVGWADLRTCFERKLGWERETAALHATRATDVLEALGVVTFLDGRITLKGNA